jgi:hypothetical protein
MVTKKRTRSKKKVPSASRKKKAMGDAVRMAVRNAMAATKKAGEAKAAAEQKVFAAKLIAHIAREAGIKGPPASVKKKAIAGARKKAAAAKKKAQKTVADAQKKARARAKAVRSTTRG